MFVTLGDFQVPRVTVDEQGYQGVVIDDNTLMTKVEVMT